MLVDSERVLLELEDFFISKNSFGSRELLRKLVELKSECRITEGVPEKALRLYGVLLSEDLISAPDAGSTMHRPAGVVDMDHRSTVVVAQRSDRRENGKPSRGTRQVRA